MSSTGAMAWPGGEPSSPLEEESSTASTPRVTRSTTSFSSSWKPTYMLGEVFRGGRLEFFGGRVLTFKGSIPTNCMELYTGTGPVTLSQQASAGGMKLAVRRFLFLPQSTNV